MSNSITDNKTRLQQFSSSAAFFCAIAYMVFIPISVALMNVFLFFTLVFTLLTGNLKNHLTTVWHNPVAKVALSLFALLSISILWSIAETDWSLRVLKKYNELWYIGLLLPIFYSSRRRDIGINAFLIIMGIILTSIYLVYFNILPSSGISIAGKFVAFTVDGGFSSHIMTNILMSFVVFVSAHKSIQVKTINKWVYRFLFAGSLYYALFISTGTTGQIIALSLLSLLLIQYFGKIALILIPVLMIIVSVLAYNIENNSIKYAINKIESRVSNAGNEDDASSKLRPQLMLHGIKTFLDSPLIGSGVGSYKDAIQKSQIEYSRLAPNNHNPHNEYILISVQLGLVGLILLLYLFYTQAISAKQIVHLEQRHLAQGLIVLFVIGCLGNSLIMDSGEGHFWAFFSALLFSNSSYQIDEN